MNVKMRQRVEKMIARRFIRDAIIAGYAININNGGQEHELPAPSQKLKEIITVMFATDEEHILVYENRPDPAYRDDPDMNSWVKIGWVYLVYGNDGYDVISDYTTNLEPLMKGADALAKKYS